MNKRIFRWNVAGFLWTAAAGTALHFFFDWTGGALWAGAVSAVNESVWEHMKLLFLPVFLFTLAQTVAAGTGIPGLTAVRAVSALAGTAFIPVAYYTYTGAVGRRFLWADVGIFLAAAAATFALDRLLLRRGAVTAPWQQLLGLAALWGLAFLFVWCTYRPPALPLWQDPLTGSYGAGRGFS